MPIISKRELLVWWQVVVSNINGSQSWVKPHQLWFDVDWRLESSTAEGVVLIPVVLPLWPCSGIKVIASVWKLMCYQSRWGVHYNLQWLILYASGLFYRNGSGSWIPQALKKKTDKKKLDIEQWLLEKLQRTFTTSVQMRRFFTLYTGTHTQIKSCSFQSCCMKSWKSTRDMKRCGRATEKTGSYDFRLVEFVWRTHTELLKANNQWRFRIPHTKSHI